MTMFTAEIVNLLYQLLTEKPNFCVVCFRTENERKLNKTDKYCLFLESIGQGRSWLYSKAKKSFICTFCCRLVERALMLMTSIKTASRLINIMDLLAGECSLVSSLRNLDGMLHTGPPSYGGIQYDRFKLIVYCNSELTKLRAQTSIDAVTLPFIDLEPDQGSIASFDDSEAEVIIENDIQIKCEDAVIISDDESSESDESDESTECNNVTELNNEPITTNCPIPTVPVTKQIDINPKLNQTALDSSLLHPIIILNNKGYVPSLNCKMVDGQLMVMTEEERDEFENETVKKNIQLPKVILDTNNTLVNQLKANENDNYIKILSETLPQTIEDHTDNNVTNENNNLQSRLEGPEAVLPVNSDTSRIEVTDTSKIALNAIPKPSVDWESKIPMEVITYADDCTLSKSKRNLKRKLCDGDGLGFIQNVVSTSDTDVKEDVIYIDD